MYYSITFTDSSGVTKNTWADWHMIPSAPPIVEPPEPYTNYVEIPGRKAGPIDLSEIIFQSELLRIQITIQSQEMMLPSTTTIQHYL